MQTLVRPSPVILDDQARIRLRTIDKHIRDRGLHAPAAEQLAYLRPAAELARGAPAELDLTDVGISAVVWATGYRPDLGWVRLPVLDAEGYPIHRRGVTKIPGLFILVLDWLHSAQSGLFGGVGEDAAYLAATIADRVTAA